MSLQTPHVSTSTAHGHNVGDEVGRLPLVDELSALGIAFVTLAGGIDATTPAWELQEDTGQNP
jgi:hypothetical protein